METNYSLPKHELPCSAEAYRLGCLDREDIGESDLEAELSQVHSTVAPSIRSEPAYHALLDARSRQPN